MSLLLLPPVAVVVEAVLPVGVDHVGVDEALITPVLIDGGFEEVLDGASLKDVQG